jgi:hypothetical protein
MRQWRTRLWEVSNYPREGSIRPASRRESHRRAVKPGVGPAIVIAYIGIIRRNATITGRHLVTLFELMSYHRIAWARERPEGKDFFRDGKATVITGIAIERLTEMPE